MEALAKPIHLLERINLIIGGAAKTLATTLIAIVLAIMVVSVFFRYVLNSSITWSEDVILMMSIWMTFAVAPIAYRYGLNVALDTFSDALKGRAARLLQIAIHILVLLLLFYLLRECIGFVERGMKIRANTVPIQMGWIYLILPASFLAMGLAGIELLLRSITGFVSPEAPEAQLPKLDLEHPEEER